MGKLSKKNNNKLMKRIQNTKKRHIKQFEGGSLGRTGAQNRVRNLVVWVIKKNPYI